MKRIFALLLCLVLCLGAVPGAYAEPTEASGDTLRVGYSPFNSKFSPFFYETAYDQDAAAMTQISLLTSDRAGAIILHGIEGETRSYGANAYTYYGPADLTITENPDGTVYYDFTLRSDLQFSDGEPVTIDDVIFSMYVLADPTYDLSNRGYGGFAYLPIQGMEEYRSGMDTLYNLIVNAGRDNTDFTYFTEEEQNAFWAAADEAYVALAQDIVDYCMANYADYGAVDVASAAGLWGFQLDEGATVEDFAAAIRQAYGDDVLTAMDTEKASMTSSDYFPTLTDYTGVGIQTGESAPSISGIQKIDDYHLRIVTTEVDATAIYQLGVSIAPMHYYGDASKYDYANNKFGFDKGDLSTVRAKTAQPMGAGPYKFVDFSDGVILYEANENYYRGAPLTRYVEFVETNSDDQKLNGVVDGTIDITDPSFSTDTVDSIKKNNSNGQLTGDKITTNTVNNLGYGYIGQNAINVKVGDDPASEQSKALRHAFATVFSVYRDTAIDSYYGDRANVINYPISDTSWAAPRPGDEGYRVAYSVDADGNPLYTSGMSADEKYAAALQGALGFFEKAGYTVADGKLTAAPEDARLEYTFWIPADGTGDHPAYRIVTRAAAALETIGMKLNIKDLTNSSDLWNNLDAIQVDMWAAAWGSTVDPDMTQIYFSDVANGPTTQQGKNPLGGPAQGGSNYEYCIADPELDQLIVAAKSSTDQAYRKGLYKQALEIVMDWAVETPTYQRQNAVIFSTERVNLDTVTPDITTFYGWMAEIENIRVAPGLPALRITGQPVDVSGPLGSKASFHVEATGDGLTYMWQSNASGAWRNTYFATSKTDTLVMNVTAARHGVSYRCRITDQYGRTITSRPATLTVEGRESLAIVSQPEDFVGPIGATATFHVEATGSGLTYRWQNDASGRWTNTSFSTSNTDTLRDKVTAARNEVQYRCVITDDAGNFIVSQPATLWVEEPQAPVITSQPQDFTGALGEYATFHVEAEGDGLTYQWQSFNNGKWVNNSFATSKTDTLRVKITEARDGAQYRCVVTDAAGNTATSDPAALHVGVVLAIVSQPEDFTGAIGEYATFHVEATGEELTYQWQSFSNGKWVNNNFTTSKTDTLRVKITEARDGAQYRCVVTDAAGNTVTSDPATLRVG